MKVPFIDLPGQYNSLKGEFDTAMQGVCANSTFVLGPHVQQFEENFAGFCEAKYCIGVASGTDALHLAFRALGIGKGDEVIVPAHTFVATALGVEMAGARPVLVDIDSDTFHIDTEKIEAVITNQTKAICPVHLYGNACNMDDLLAMADKHNLAIVEDAAQSHGARWAGKRSGSFGTAGCFSFYPGKNLGAFGDGGAVVTDDADVAKKLRCLRNYGSEIKYQHPEFGLNSRLDGVQAAILNIKLERLEQWNEQRWEAAKRYSDGLQSLAQAGKIILPDIKSSDEHVFHLFVMQLENRDGLMQALAEQEIQSGIHYPNPYYLEGAFKHLGYCPGDFPVTESIAQKIVSLPMFPEITCEQTDYVCEQVHQFLK